MPDFQPFVSPDENRPEFTFRAILLGSLFGIIFGGVTVYVGLRAGLTVAASIPYLYCPSAFCGRSAGFDSGKQYRPDYGKCRASIAAGVIFPCRRLIFLGFDSSIRASFCSRSSADGWACFS